MKTKERQSNIELLRIIAILCVVFSHYSRHSGFTFDMDRFNINLIYTQITTLGNLGVNIFVLIAGFFLSTRERPISNVIPIWRAAWIYSVAIYLIVCVLHLHQFSYMEGIKSLFPVITEEWWFITTYIILMIFAPYLTRFINSISKDSYSKLLIILFVVWMVIPTFTNQYLKCNDLLWFFTLYLTGGYIQKYKDDFNRSFAFYGALSAAAFGIFVLSVIVLNILFLLYPSIGNHGDFFSGKQLILMPVLSALLLIFFMKLPMKQSKLINTISSSTLGIYLIHDNHYVRDILWGGVRIISEDSCWFIPYSIVVVIMVFVCCSLIEMIRMKFESFIIVESRLAYIDKLIVKHVNRLLSFFIKKNHTGGLKDE